MTDLVLTALSERWPELVAALVFTFVGTRWSRLRAHQRLRDRIAFELAETQRAMRDRAAPLGGFKRDGIREEWMLEPYTMRVDFLARLSNTEGLGSDAEIAITAYRDELKAFVQTWAEARAKARGFREAYMATCDRLEASLKALGRRRKYRSELDKLRLFDDPVDADTSGRASLDPLDTGATDAEAISDSDLSQPTS